MHRWGTVLTGTTVVLSVILANLALCLAMNDNKVYAQGLTAFIALIGARMAWLYASWDIRQDELQPLTRVTEADMGSLTFMMPPTCPDTGARELSNMEKNCEMFNYMFLAVMFLFVGLLTDAKYTAAMFCAAVSGFLIGGAG